MILKSALDYQVIARKQQTIGLVCLLNKVGQSNAAHMLNLYTVEMKAINANLKLRTTGNFIVELANG